LRQRRWIFFEPFQGTIMKTRTWRESIRLLAAMCCVLSGVTVWGMQEAAAPAAPAADEQQDTATAEQEAYKVGFERLNTERIAAGELVANKLKPQQEKLRQEFSTAIAELRELLKKLSKDPKNRLLKSTYEEKLSSTIVNASRLLKEWTDQAPAANTALDGYAARLAEARATYQDQLNKATVEAAELAQTKADTEDRLRAIAEHHSELLKSGQPLPPELNDDVPSLQLELENAELRSTLAAANQRTFANSLKTIEKQAKTLGELRKSLELKFHRALQGQAALVAVAEARTAKINNEQLKQALEELVQLKDVPKASHDELVDFLSGDLLRDPEDSPTDAEPGPGPDEAQGDVRRILKRYLPTPEKPETNNATAAP